VIVQVALSLVLVTATGLLVRSFQNLLPTCSIVPFKRSARSWIDSDDSAATQGFVDLVVSVGPRLDADHSLQRWTRSVPTERLIGLLTPS